jgi:hypothetical protein
MELVEKLKTKSMCLAQAIFQISGRKCIQRTPENSHIVIPPTPTRQAALEDALSICDKIIKIK